MSNKKDRFNFRRYQHPKHTWGVPKEYRYWNKWDGIRGIRAKNKQLIREGKYEEFKLFRRDSGWHYW